MKLTKVQDRFIKNKQYGLFIDERKIINRKDINSFDIEL